MQNTHYSLPGILAALKIDTLNPMQLASIEANKAHRNVILLSATGSGKTLAFLLPVLNRIDTSKKGTQALIITPTRELTLQIEQVIKSMGTNIRVTSCYGGHKREIEENNLAEAPAIIIGTPGRLGDHIRRGNIHPETIETLVLDEFDKSVEFGFEEEMSFVVGSLPSLSKRILVSATKSDHLPGFLHMRQAEELNFLTGEAPEKLEVQFVKSDDIDKLQALFRLICHLGNRSAIVFCNYRDAVERVSNFLRQQGIVNVFYHGALEQPERDAAISKFRNGTSNVLVTTDLASRGLDIPNIRYIIHYHLPEKQEVFTHRNGRTARMEASGTAILIISPEEQMPDYIEPGIPEILLPEQAILPEKPKWTTFHFSFGKKDKVNKVDFVGFLSQKGELKKEDIGLIDVKDFHTFVAVRKSKASHVLTLIRDQRIKGKKVKVEIAK